MVKIIQDNRLPTHRHIYDIINKALEALDLPIPIAECSLKSSNISLVGSPLHDILKLPIYDGLWVIIPPKIRVPDWFWVKLHTCSRSLAHSLSALVQSWWKTCFDAILITCKLWIIFEVYWCYPRLYFPILLTSGSCYLCLINKLISSQDCGQSIFQSSCWTSIFLVIHACSPVMCITY